MLITDVSTGPDSCRIPFYGTESFQMGGKLQLKGNAHLTELYKDSNLYFVRTVEYAIEEDGAFLFLVEHFEDGMLSAYAYRLGPDDSRALLEVFPDKTALRKSFGISNGGDLFLQYCAARKFHVDYTKYWV